jgi:hypothetical protein
MGQLLSWGPESMRETFRKVLVLFQSLESAGSGVLEIVAEGDVARHFLKRFMPASISDFVEFHYCS